jgi:hypothetical protein
LGLLIITSRLILLVILKLLISIHTPLTHNPHFINACCFAFGLKIRLKSKVNNEPVFDPTKSNIFISNHVTCLDQFSIKSIVTNLIYINTDLEQPPQHLFTDLLNATRSNKQDDEFYAKKSNYPMLFFPERSCTNGTRGLLKFDDQLPFDLLTNNASNDGLNRVIVPVYLKVLTGYF